MNLVRDSSNLKVLDRALPTNFTKIAPFQDKTSSQSLEETEKINSLSAPLLESGEMRCVRTLKGHRKSVLALCMLSKEILASASQDTTIKLWDPNKGDLIGTLIGHDEPVVALSSFKDGTLVSGSSKGNIKYWDPYKKNLLISVNIAHPVSILALACSENDTLVSAAEDKTIKIWTKKGELRRKITYVSEPFFLSKLQDGLIAISYRNNAIKLLNHHAIVKHMDYARKFSHIVMLTNNVLAGVEPNGTIRVWEYLLGKTKTTINAHTSNHVTFSLINENTLVSMPKDTGEDIKLWDFESGTLKQTLIGHTGIVRSVIMIQEGILASGADDNNINIWEKM